MKCPKCKGEMEDVTFQHVTVKRCRVCEGIWFNMLEHEELKVLKGSEVIDTGDPAKGKLFNEIDRIVCPKCHSAMVRMVDNEQPHIWFESCAVCHGVFFDAGEFTDYKQFTVSDWFKKWVTKDRR